jgi:hypothetical protein
MPILRQSLRSPLERTVLPPLRVHPEPDPRSPLRRFRTQLTSAHINTNLRTDFYFYLLIDHPANLPLPRPFQRLPAWPNSQADPVWVVSV